MKVKFLIITGLSGAGKSQALKILEDLGFFCVDNLPIALLPRFADLCVDPRGKFNKVALGIDIRAGKTHLASIEKVLREISKKGIKYKILFFNSNDSTLLKRYSETRRRHPLGRRVIDGIKKERKMMSKLRNIATQEINTSNLNLGELKELLAKILGISYDKKIKVSLISFGYKYGLPIDSDIVIDVRFLPNPNYVESLRTFTGQNFAVKKYIEKQPQAKDFFHQFQKMLEFLIPKYIREGKNYLTISIGCTGGRHRSVVVTEHIAGFLKRKKYYINIHHRDINRK